VTAANFGLGCSGPSHAKGAALFSQPGQCD